ncbi:MAG TPA: ZIP family metal transporter [Bryobacteraceae bacterium]|nr:ZIP family metal transporter [Bryobacteraceae bacterium]
MPSLPHSEIIHTLAALTIVSAASLAGSASFALGKRLDAALPYLVSAATGALLATAVTHLLPEAIQQFGYGSKFCVLLLFGFLVSFLLERLVWVLFQKTRNGVTAAAERDGSKIIHHAHEHCRPHGIPLSTNILLSGAIHSLVDGMAIAAAFGVGHSAGVATTIAVLLHEVPHHIADVGVLMYTGLTKSRAIVMNLFATTGCAMGGVVVLAVGTGAGNVSQVLLPITAANFLYVAIGILMPELQKERDGRRSMAQVVCLLATLLFIFELGRFARD